MLVDKLRSKIFLRNKLARGALGEFFGTFLLVFIGECIVAQYHLTGARNVWININVGWGFAVAFCILATGKSSGGHINPAVTLMLFSFGAVDAITTVVYFAAQTAGAFMGALATYFFYIDAIDDFDGGIRVAIGKNGTAGIFTTFAPDYLSVQGAFFDQFVGAGILCLFIAAILDKKNEIPGCLHALFFGFVVMMIGCAFGHHIGYPINPARDFGPRLFALIVYGSKVFTYPYPVYFLMPILGPLVGGPVGGWLYQLCAGYQIPYDDSRSEKHVNGHHQESSSLLEGKEKSSP